MAPNTYSAETPDDLRKLSTKSGKRLLVLSDLTKEEIKRSASSWTRKYLVVYRLLIEKSDIKYLFHKDHSKACPACCELDDEESLKVDSVALDNLSKIRHRDLEGEHSSQLLKRPGGFLWVSLAEAICAGHGEDEPRSHPSRERKQSKKEGFVQMEDTPSVPSSTSGSFSDQRINEVDDDVNKKETPAAPASACGSDYSQRTQEVDDDVNETRQDIPENVSVHLALDFIRYCLCCCLKQDGATEIRPRVRTMRSMASIAGVEEVTCEDDGGIALYVNNKGSWKIVKPFLASLEAKRAPKNLKDDGSPELDDDILAQYLGEAVLTWRANPDLQDNGTFMRFMHFKFDEHYAQYLDASTAREQLALIDDNTKKTCVHLTCTKWYNLELLGGRKAALCNILAMIKWHKDNVNLEV
ncbi:hypothetical protein E4U55_001754 [Claviceps digitariae]|nr:hypothetical protein E4U55_001754 [Claviceps digitariae]